MVTAIEDVLADIDVKLAKAHANFEKRTNEHNTEVRRLTDLINECARNIADTTVFIEDVLIP